MEERPQTTPSNAMPDLSARTTAASGSPAHDAEPGASVFRSRPSLWSSIDELGKALQSAYSVTDLIRQRYIDQVRQYPLYLPAMDRVIACIDSLGPHSSVIEYGPGPGILAERISIHHNVAHYVAVEPEAVFRRMTEASLVGPTARISMLDSRAEELVLPEQFDLAVATATYHHFDNKPLALANILSSLKQGGELVMMDVFFRDYAYDLDYNPLDRTDFVEKVLECASAQILAMDAAGDEQIIDQMRTAFLDILQIEEMKVCSSVLIDQLTLAGFEEISCELMNPDDYGDCASDCSFTQTGRDDASAEAHLSQSPEEKGRVDSESLGYYFVKARKKGDS